MIARNLAPNLTLAGSFTLLAIVAIHAGMPLVLAVAKAALIVLACFIAACLICREKRS